MINSRRASIERPCSLRGILKKRGKYFCQTDVLSKKEAVEPVQGAEKTLHRNPTKDAPQAQTLLPQQLTRAAASDFVGAWCHPLSEPGGAGSRRRSYALSRTGMGAA